jgi:hypothetical protein
LTPTQINLVARICENNEFFFFNDEIQQKVFYPSKTRGLETIEMKLRTKNEFRKTQGTKKI